MEELRCANKATARAVSASNMEWSSASSAQRTRVSDTTHVTCVSWLARSLAGMEPAEVLPSGQKVARRPTET